jgi:hypothetical protein
MNLRVLFSAGLVALTVAVFAGGKDPVTLQWKPKEGASYKFSTKFAGSVQGTDFQITADMVETIQKVNGDKTVTVVDKSSNMQGTAGGQEIPGIPDSQTDTIIEGPDGHVITRKSDAQQQNPRADNFSQFIFPTNPVNVGDTWKYVGKGDKAAGTYDYEIDYTYRGADTQNGIQCYKIDVTMKETSGSDPMSGAGTIWLDSDTGELAKVDIKLKNVASPMGAMDLEVTENRKS